MGSKLARQGTGKEVSAKIYRGNKSVPRTTEVTRIVSTETSRASGNGAAVEEKDSSGGEMVKQSDKVRKS
jgi:hypothetical protein